jgi:hypothetical protein
MKKLLSIALLGATLTSSAFASNIEYLGLLDHSISAQAKYLDIHDSGIDSGWVYGLKYMTNKDLGEQGAWGVTYQMEFNYGNLDLKSGGDTTYTEFSVAIGPSYTFECKAKAYLLAKAGYADFGNKVSSDSGSNGGVLAGVLGVEYPIMKHLIVGIEGEYGKTYIDTLDFDTNSFGG